jgi:predicted RNA-binding protein with PIN domain
MGRGRTQLRSGQVEMLIDAHNLIHAHPDLRRLMDDPEVAREALLARLQGRQRVRMVCDGGPRGERATVVRHGITIEYSGRLDADECIIAYLRAHARQRTVVVTDDRGLAGRARVMGARVLPCAALIASLTAPASGEADPRRAPPPPHEVEEWLRLFGGDADQPLPGD